jgi:hypothetical protein
MRIRGLGGVLCLIVAASLASGGGSPKQALFKEQGNEEISALLGDWEAAVQTKAGWKGTLRANVARKLNHPEGSTFHTFVSVRYDLKLADRKPAVVVAGTVGFAVLPCSRDRQRYLQCLRQDQVLLKEWSLEVLEAHPEHKKALKVRTDLEPSKLDTAQYSSAAGTWTLELAPVVREMLPKAPPKAPAIDWDSSIVWTKVKRK